MGRQKRQQDPIDLRVDLESCYISQLNRRIGVLVSAPFMHVGLNKMMVDVEYEYPIVNTGTAGGPKGMDEKDEAIRKGLCRCIRECRKIRDDLDRHAFRLGEELKKHGGDPNDVE
jgi:hypothetical protein